jgi:hypothetical protein
VAIHREVHLYAHIVFTYWALILNNPSLRPEELDMVTKPTNANTYLLTAWS